MKKLSRKIFANIIFCSAIFYGFSTHASQTPCEKQAKAEKSFVIKNICSTLAYGTSFACAYGVLANSCAYAQNGKPIFLCAGLAAGALGIVTASLGKSLIRSAQQDLKPSTLTSQELEGSFKYQRKPTVTELV